MSSATASEIVCFVLGCLLVSITLAAGIDSLEIPLTAKWCLLVAFIAIICIIVAIITAYEYGRDSRPDP